MWLGGMYPIHSTYILLWTSQDYTCGGTHCAYVRTIWHHHNKKKKKKTIWLTYVLGLIVFVKYHVRTKRRNPLFEKMNKDTYVFEIFHYFEEGVHHRIICHFFVDSNIRANAHWTIESSLLEGITKIFQNIDAKVGIRGLKWDKRPYPLKWDDTNLLSRFHL